VPGLALRALERRVEAWPACRGIAAGVEGLAGKAGSGRICPRDSGPKRAGRPEGRLVASDVLRAAGSRAQRRGGVAVVPGSMPGTRTTSRTASCTASRTACTPWPEERG
jgi:hypothetical protein